MSKPTLSTLKSFVKKNREALHIKVRGSFDGMTDCVEHNRDAQFLPATESDIDSRHTLGVNGIWLVLGSRDHITPYFADGFSGYQISNCCGSFIVAVKS
jgi:hypothetical protein